MIRLRALPLVAVLALVPAVACTKTGDAPTQRTQKGLVVLGIDGMDPGLASQYMAQGRMPNLAALAAKGTYAKLATSSPPESPVAWSDFITSMHSEGHGIYDFVHRDLKTMGPYLSTSRVTPPTTVLHLGPWALPIGGGKVELLRGGRPFWSYLDDAGVPATILEIPAEYPPETEGKARVAAGMGTPDLLGTYGVFQYYTDDPAWEGRVVNGGEVHMIKVERGARMKLNLSGPPDPFSSRGVVLKSPFELVVDAREPVVMVQFGDEQRVLKVGEWSGWLPVSFDPGLLSRSVPGMVRVFVKSVTPRFALYVSPLNIDPTAPAQPFATPGFAESLAAGVGRFHTIGIPEDDKAAEAGALSDPEYLELFNYIYEERLRMIDYELDHFHGGLLFGYIGTIDQVSHAFFRTLDADAPPDLKKLANVIPDYYARVDAFIGHVVERAGPDTPVIVMSDHGHAPYRTKVNLNTWLERNGYLVAKPAGAEDSGAPLARIDWTKTRAYALGINLLYVNLRGREPGGIVAPEEREALLQKIKTQLEALTDPISHEHPISKVSLPKPGRYPERMPDAVIGYARGFRSSDASAVGALTATVFDRNEDKWRGDHCMDPDLVPGVIASTLRLDTKKAALVDLGPTILDYFGVARPPAFVGRSLLKPPGAD
jgi:predicted AlkP superfamily phosphohydrolase/phosphomutase